MEIYDGKTRRGQQKIYRKKKKKKGRREDRISRLPDALLQHILSFLPTKCTVCTSVLSKRWRNIWTGVPALSFLDWPCFAPKEKRLLEVERLLSFMDKRLPTIHHGNMPNIQKFYLHLSEFISYESPVNAWITTLVSSKLEELTLVAFMGEVSLFPPSFFISKSLTTLDLKMYIEFKPPGLVYLPQLKILRLTYIKFTDTDLSLKFFSGCPVLEQLSLDKCSWGHMVVSILFPFLKCLSITNYSGTPHLEGSTFKIHAPNLVSLNYVETVSKISDLTSCSSLVDSDIHFPYLYQYFPERRGQVCSRTAKLLAGLSNVKLLKLSGETFEALSFADERLANLCSFNNLVHLEVSSAMRCSTLRALFDLLLTSRNLKSLVFAEDFNGTSPFHLNVDDDSDSLIQSLMGQCLLLHLESVEFKKFNGHPRELDVVKLFLRNAVVLKRLIIEDSSYSRNKKNVIQQLQNIPRGSKNCVVRFSTASCVSYLYK